MELHSSNLFSQIIGDNVLVSCSVSVFVRVLHSIFKHLVVCECDTKFASGLIHNADWQMEYT